MRRVFLGGEGATELGGWAKERSYRTNEPGVLETLARKVQAESWEIVDAVCWKTIRKYQAGRSDHHDVDNVLGLLLEADEAGCDLVIFSRDDDRDDDTAEAVREGMRRGGAIFDLVVVGGPCRPCIEGWVLATCGERRTEAMSPGRAKDRASERCGLGRSALVDAIEAADLGDTPRFVRVPDDAVTLRAWLQAAIAALRTPSVA